jgi:hypothetical protein
MTCSADIWRMMRVIGGTSAYGSSARVCTNSRPVPPDCVSGP